MLDLSTNIITALAEYEEVLCGSPALSGNRIVWQAQADDGDGVTDWDIYLREPACQVRAYPNIYITHAISLSMNSLFGAYCHEFAHDLYFEIYYHSKIQNLYREAHDYYPVGRWDIMAYGHTLDDGWMPSELGGFSKFMAGWVQPGEHLIFVQGSAGDIWDGNIWCTESPNGQIILVTPEPPPDATAWMPYYLIELRLGSALTSTPTVGNIHQQGILIWKIYPHETDAAGNLVEPGIQIKHNPLVDLDALNLYDFEGAFVRLIDARYGSAWGEDPDYPELWHMDNAQFEEGDIFNTADDSDAYFIIDNIIDNGDGTYHLTITFT
jgi:hypothetical protein